MWCGAGGGNTTKWRRLAREEEEPSRRVPFPFPAFCRSGTGVCTSRNFPKATSVPPTAVAQIIPIANRAKVHIGQFPSQSTPFGTRLPYGGREKCGRGTTGRTGARLPRHMPQRPVPWSPLTADARPCGRGVALGLCGVLRAVEHELRHDRRWTSTERVRGEEILARQHGRESERRR